MRTIRIVTLLAVGLVSASAARAQRPAGNKPLYGTLTESVLTLYAWDFHPVDDRMVFGVTSPGSYYRYCISSIAPYDPHGYLEAAVHLPTGALITFINLAACDNDFGEDAVATLYSAVDGTAGSSVIAAVSSSGVGCQNWETGLDYTVANFPFSLAVEVQLPTGNSNVSLRAVHIFYRLQVSPPPDTATFNDVPTTHQFFQYIEALAASGITAGCQTNPPLYCPDSPLTRGQMAAFLAKALGLHWPF